MEKIFDWKKRFYQVHKPDRVDPKALETLTGTKVTDGWKVIPQPGTGVVLNNAAWDLTDYFAVSMNAKVALAEAGESTPNSVWVGVDEALGERNFRIDQGYCYRASTNSWLAFGIGRIHSVLCRIW